jgi:hypothetical protein
MVDIQQNLNIPCFYHVPKNAGTYIISIMFLYFRLFRRSHTNWLSLKKETGRNIVIHHDNKEIARIIAGDPNFICNESLIFKRGVIEDNTHYTINLNECSHDVFINLNIFSIIIEADGFVYHDQIKKFFEKYNLIDFMILRDPVKRAVSFFDYINSDKAKHEPTYGIIPNKFSEYAKSAYTEDSWLIRQFSKVQNSVGITLKNYVDVFHILKKFKICDIKNTNKFIDDIFKQYLNLNLTEKQKQQNGWDIIYNSKSKSSTIIDEESHKLLQQRMIYDIELYNKLLSC